MVPPKIFPPFESETVWGRTSVLYSESVSLELSLSISLSAAGT